MAMSSRLTVLLSAQADTWPWRRLRKEPASANPRAEWITSRPPSDDG